MSELFFPSIDWQSCSFGWLLFHAFWLTALFASHECLLAFLILLILKLIGISRPTFIYNTKLSILTG
jgi:hypothetical protein